MHFNLSGLIGIVGVAALSLLPARAATTAVLSYTPGEFRGFGAPTVNGGAMNEVTGPFTFSNVDGLGLNVRGTASSDGILELRGNHDHFNLRTDNFVDANTVANSQRFYRVTVTIFHDATGCAVGSASFTLETRPP